MMSNKVSYSFFRVITFMGSKNKTEHMVSPLFSLYTIIRSNPQASLPPLHMTRGCARHVAKYAYIFLNFRCNPKMVTHL